MSGRMVFTIIVIILLSISTALTISNYLASLEDVEIAKQEEEKAKAEYEEASREVDTILSEAGQ